MQLHIHEIVINMNSWSAAAPFHGLLITYGQTTPKHTEGKKTLMIAAFPQQQKMRWFTSAAPFATL